jgi:hypothetical protein
MERTMKIKMLTGLSGRDFSLMPNDLTDRFNDKESKRLIKEGYAEKAPPEVLKKPETKQEWDDERAKLIAENERLNAALEQSAEREAALSLKAESLERASIAFAEIFDMAPKETAVKPQASGNTDAAKSQEKAVQNPAQEKRG